MITQCVLVAKESFGEKGGGKASKGCENKEKWKSIANLPARIRIAVCSFALNKCESFPSPLRFLCAKNSRTFPYLSIQISRKVCLRGLRISVETAQKEKRKKGGAHTSVFFFSVSFVPFLFSLHGCYFVLRSVLLTIDVKVLVDSPLSKLDKSNGAAAILVN